MIKKIFFLAFICALVGCQKEIVQLDYKELISSNKSNSSDSYKLSDTPDFKDLPAEVKDIITNGGVGHFGCENIYNKPSADGSSSLDITSFFGSSTSSLGTYAYPYTLSMSPIKLYNSSLPCQPNTPYFIFSYLDSEGEGKNTKYSVAFHLVINPIYFNPVNVVDISWELNGLNNPGPVNIFTINDLHIGDSYSVACKVFSTENNTAVYSQEMPFDFEISIEPGTGPIIEFVSGYSYACTNTGIFPIVAP